MKPRLINIIDLRLSFFKLGLPFSDFEILKPDPALGLMLAVVIFWPVVAQIRLRTYRQGSDEEKVGYADDSFALCRADFKMRVHH